MKQIINGKKYDTETAKKLGDYSNGRSRSDFAFCEEELYIKKTGEFFIYGCGGPLSKYSVPEGNGVSGDSKIIPLTENEAKKWAEANLSVDKYESIFGEVEE